MLIYHHHILPYQAPSCLVIMPAAIKSEGKSIKFQGHTTTVVYHKLLGLKEICQTEQCTEKTSKKEHMQLGNKSLMKFGTVRIFGNECNKSKLCYHRKLCNDLGSDTSVRR
jgi:hypothetical protein